MTSNYLLNALYDPSLADIFLEILSARDLGAFMPLAAQVNKNVYDWIFIRTLYRQYNVNLKTVQKIRMPVIKIPARFKKVYAQFPRIDLSKSAHNLNFILTTQLPKNYAVKLSSVLGIVLYACTTNWVVLHSEIIPKISETIINAILRDGMHVAFDSKINIDKVAPDKNSYRITTSSLHKDDILTSFFRIPNLTVYSGGNYRPNTLIYLQTTDPAIIRDVVHTINKKLLVTHNYGNYVTVCFPSSQTVRLLPYIFYGAQAGLPARISYSIAEQETVWRHDTAVFHEYPPIRSNGIEIENDNK